MLSPKIRRIIIVAILLVLFAISRTIPIKQSITGSCVVTSIEDWTIERNGSGEVATVWEKRLQGTSSITQLFQFERPDKVEFQLMENVFDKAYVSKGDTLARIVSTLENNQLKELKKELDLVISVRDALLTGQREVDLNIAIQEINKVNTEIQAHQPQLERDKEQYEAGLIPVSQWEFTLNQQKLLEAELDLAKALLVALETGARFEDISVANMEIRKIEQMIRNTEKSLSILETVISPLTGVIKMGRLNGPILRISRIDSLAIVTTVPQQAAGLVSQGKLISHNLYVNSGNIFLGKVIRIGYSGTTNSANILSFIENHDREITRGMVGLTSISLGKLTLWEGIKLRLKRVYL
ncbi:hypothetical protein H8D57_01815 [bacterium]|nr:hypothetical protein [bacterium]